MCIDCELYTQYIVNTLAFCRHGKKVSTPLCVTKLNVILLLKSGKIAKRVSAIENARKGYFKYTVQSQYAPFFSLLSTDSTIYNFYIMI